MAICSIACLAGMVRQRSEKSHELRQELINRSEREVSKILKPSTLSSIIGKLSRIGRVGLAFRFHPNRTMAMRLSEEKVCGKGNVKLKQGHWQTKELLN